MDRMFIRIGDIPLNGKSKIRFRGQEVVGEEIGVSVWDAANIYNKWHIVVPNPCDEDTIDDIHGGLLQAICYGNPIYLVTGSIIGIGSDGEPLLKKVKIIEDISNHFSYLKPSDEPILEITD